MKQYQVIRRPLVTEKGQAAQERTNQYLFEVDPRATKHDITNAVHNIFKVKVVGVRTMNNMGKIRRVGQHFGRKPAWKKAVVTLKEGDRIEFLEGA